MVVRDCINGIIWHTSDHFECVANESNAFKIAELLYIIEFKQVSGLADFWIQRSEYGRAGRKHLQILRLRL